MIVTEDNMPEILSKLFKESGKQKQVVARRADIHPNSITFWLTRKANPTLPQLVRVLAAMGKQLEVHDIENRN